jgi:gamma-glutamylcysteine synthetase
MYNYDPIMEITKMIKSAIDTVTELDEEMTKLKCETNNNNTYEKNGFRYDDNLVAIDMMKDVTSIIEGIERNDVRNIRNSLQRLKNHTDKFDKVFNYFLSTGAYR